MPAALLSSSSPLRWITRPLRPLALAGSLALLAACGTPVVNPVSGKVERSVMDESTEIAEGRKAHEQILTEYKRLDNPRLQAYVSDLGQKLARQSHRSNLPWTFTVLDSPEVNAFALPGGYVYITRGMLAYLEDEADLAGVLGHEIGHVTARHGAQRATRQQTAGLGVLAATVLGVVLESQGVGGAAQAASQVSQGVAAGHLASYSREQETQADQLGAEYLSRTGYNPRNMIQVIQVLKSQERFAADSARAEGRAVPSGAGWLATHPSNDQRLADIQQFAARYAAPAYQDDARGRYLQMIDGITFGDSREQGVVRGRNFFHEDLGIALTAPQGWRVRNGADAVTLVNAEGDAGLIVRLAPRQAGTDHDAVIRQVVQPVDGRVTRTNFNGLSATRFEGVRRDAQGQTQPVRVSVVSGPGGQVFLLQHAARDAATLQRSAWGLSEAESSLRPLSAAERAAARPYVLRTATMPRGGFAELARNSPDPARSEAQLRLLNGAYATGAAAEPRPGMLVKVVQ